MFAAGKGEIDYGQMIDAVLTGASRQSLDHIFQTKYDELRKHEYPPSGRYHVEIAAVSSQPGNHGVTVSIPADSDQKQSGSKQKLNKDLQGWHVRESPKISLKRDVARVAFNAYPEPAIIDKLDAFVMKHRLSYKVADTAKRWQNRHDTGIVYFSKEPTVEQLDELKTIIAPHVRANALSGEQLAEGVYLAREPSEAVIRTLIGRGTQVVGKSFGDWIQAQAEKHAGDEKVDLMELVMLSEGLSEEEFAKLLDAPPMNWHLSVGAVEVITAMIDAYEKFKATGTTPPDTPHADRHDRESRPRSK